MILALETSCDDTCAAVLSNEGRVESNVISSQASLHGRYGGIVPEVASRRHLQLINAVVEAALSQAGVELDDIGLVAATSGPGLIGALLIGVSTGKALAAARKLPFVPVNHLQGHIAANFIGEDPLQPPFICLIASGGHTLLVRVEDRRSYQLLGQTLDDAAGEAFDKGARLLGLGYPGGAALDKLSEHGDASAHSFPIGMQTQPRSLDFSYSGLKTALAYKLKELAADDLEAGRADIAAAYQEAICRQLIEKAERALSKTGLTSLAVGGGVAANGRLRVLLRDLGRRCRVQVQIPPHELCTDNAAMIASAARFQDPISYPDYLEFDAFATSKVA